MLKGLESRFTQDGPERLYAMEGLRSLAVFLVFLQHYCAQFAHFFDFTGITAQFIVFFKGVGNVGVELFFVLSGYLIYSILLKRTPKFFPFMKRRAIRLYPAFLVAFAIGVALDQWRPTPNIPPGFFDGFVYLLANLAFLPGLFPINPPLFSVNWSLSYEWWFYAACVVVVSIFGLGRLQPRLRIAFILAVMVLLVVLSASGLKHVPIRGLPLFAGMLLVEVQRMGTFRVPSSVAIIATVVAISAGRFHIDLWVHEIIMSVGFFLLVHNIMDDRSAVGRFFSYKPFRWFGNMSYSYYLVHGFVIVILAHLILPRLDGFSPVAAVWIGLVPVFVMTVIVSAMLYLFVEEPLSLRKPAQTAPSGDTKTPSQQHPKPAET